ncbi:MAG: hypothetical protein J07HN4v3_01983 [Halonotius sp. J07HN4]|jgi:hypothetical protein|nr:MAG: hypothetical protein J07HN4v3_01983 [Halonotius sp. J07HN4]
MSESTSSDSDEKPGPLEIVFGDRGVPNDCQVTSNRVRCSPLSHHAGLLPIKSGLKIGKTFDHDERQGGGMMTAKQIIQPAYQLKTEFGDRVVGGFFADVMTPDHEAYPMTVYYGFRLQAATDGFRFANSVGEKITEHFQSADVVATAPTEVAVLTNADPFPHQLVEGLRE